MTYEIKYEPITVADVLYPKYNIYYTGGPYDGSIEFHSIDGKINGTEIDGYTDVNAPDWHGLEQDLRYQYNESLFYKAFAEATGKGLTLFMTTLLNGKKGEASENALSTAFNCLSVDVNDKPAPLNWTTEEKGQINTILSNNNFLLRLT